MHNQATFSWHTKQVSLCSWFVMYLDILL